MSNIIPFPRNRLKRLSRERLLYALDAAITATDSYEYLIERIASVFEACEHASVGQPLDELAVFKAVNEVELCIIASAGDPRVIGLCRRALTHAGIGDEEIRISPEGEVERRMVYFARSARGFITIGSSMTVAARLSALESTDGGTLELILAMPGSLGLERQLHRQFAALREHGQWFRAEPELESYIENLRATFEGDAA